MQPSKTLQRAAIASPKSLTQYPQTMVTTISLPLIPEETNTHDRRQWLHLRVTRILYFFRGDYFVEGFLSSSSNPDEVSGRPALAQEMTLKVWIEDPIGMSAEQSEYETTQCTFSKVYTGNSDFCTRHRIVAQLSLKMPSGWSPHLIETDELAIS